MEQIAQSVPGASDRKLGRGRLVVVAALLVIAVGFGGGGRGYPLFNVWVQLAALAALALQPAAVVHFFRQAPAGLVAIVTATLLLPLLQLVPLPPGVWKALPGRDLVAETLALIGRESEWMPYSVDPSLTLLAFVGLVPPFAILVLAWDLPSEDKRRILFLLVGLGLLQLLIGALQLASGGTVLQLYSGRSPNFLYGTFSNHNATGLFLVISLCALVGIGHRFPLQSRPWSGAGAWIVGLSLVLGVVLTQSRSSIALLILPVGAACILTSRERCFRIRRTRILASVLCFAIVAGSVGAFAASDRIRQTVERFGGVDARLQIWEDGHTNAARFWPAGSGLGTFDEVFQLDESLEHITPERAGRAHNDYLEVAIEAGLPGLALVAGWVLHLSLIYARARRKPLTLGAFVSLLGFGAQSVVDYPLRNAALLCVAALFVSLLHSQSDHGKEHRLV